jgi:hypothetical protein
MTYLHILQAPVQVSYFNPSYSGNPTSGNYVTMTVGGLNQASVTGTGTTTLVLSPGSYFVRCTLGGTKTGGASNLVYQLELGGTLVGNEGGYDTSSNNVVSTELSEAVFEISSNTNLRVKITASSGTNSISDTYSGMIIRRLS